MKTIGKLATAIVILALMGCAAINTAVHIKSGEVKELFTPEQQVEVEAPAETPAE